MKTKTFAKEGYFQLFLVAVVLLLISCDSNPKTEDTKDIATEQNDAKFDDKEAQNDAEFLVNAAEINLEEIQLSHLAQTKGNSTHVKELGMLLESSHTKILSELKSMAQSKVISIPTSETENAQKAYKQLNEESAGNFDKSYADMMVEKHKDAIAVFEKASTNCNDIDIKNWATQTLPEIRTHFDNALICQKKSDQMHGK
ncbi:MAG: DUF4142 domain-containing protein [Bacteroidia bacterium]|nr:DUF4142 domain-containing protein [Bacteroidia bacterium]